MEVPLRNRQPPQRHGRRAAELEPASLPPPCGPAGPRLPGPLCLLLPLLPTWRGGEGAGAGGAAARGQLSGKGHNDFSFFAAFETGCGLLIKTLPQRRFRKEKKKKRGKGKVWPLRLRGSDARAVPWARGRCRRGGGSCRRQRGSPDGGVASAGLARGVPRSGGGARCGRAEKSYPGGGDGPRLKAPVGGLKLRRRVGRCHRAAAGSAAAAGPRGAAGPA